MTQGRWKCARCKSIIISDHQVVSLSNEEMEEAARQMYYTDGEDCNADL